MQRNPRFALLLMFAQRAKQIVTAEFTKLYKNLDNSQTIAPWPNRKITKHRLTQTIESEFDVTASQGDQEMSKSRTVMFTASALFALGLTASQGWAGEVKGKVTAVGMRSAENL